MSSRKVSLTGGSSTTTIAAAAALDRAENAAQDKKDSTLASVKASETDSAKTNAGGTESTAAKASTDTPPKEAKSFLETAKSCVAQTIRTMVAKTTASDSVTSKESKEDVIEDNKTEDDEEKDNEDEEKASEEEKEDATATEAVPAESDSGKDAAKAKEKPPTEADNNKKASEPSVKAEEEVKVEEEAAQLKEPPSRNSAKEGKRVTRNSPLLVTSAANKKDVLGGGDSAEGVELDEGSATSVVAKRAGQIRGRKSIKDAAAAKDAAAGEPVELKEEMTKMDPKKAERDSEERVSCEKDKAEESDFVDCRAEPEAAAEIAVAIKEEPVEQPAPTRQTRKSVAKEPIPNTRVTRNRQSSTGSTSQPASAAPAKSEATPPQAAGNEGRRGRKPGWGKKGAAAAATPPADVANSKRKRSSLDDAPAAPVGEPGPKYAKVEVAKDDDEGGEEDATTTSDSAAATPATEEIKIKQELMESDESSSATDVSSAANPAATPPATAPRGRGRWNSRRSANRLTFSPSTRSTRQSKAVTSPSPTPPPSASGPPPGDSKRRRTGTPNATTRSSSSLSLRRTAAASQQAPDEDSKDSLASSMDDILMGEPKAEKLSQPESEEAVDFEMAEKVPLAEEEDSEPAAKVKKVASATPTPTANGLVEELTVDTGDEVAASGEGGEDKEPPTTPVASTSATSVLNGDSGSEKAASLSPELISEGVSEISVKQFYKTPKFRENNLGIEEDPKLGELVQKVATPSEADGEAEGEVEKGLKDDDCLSNASIQEGELRFDESSDEKKEADSSTLALSPLTVAETEGGEEEEAEAETPLLEDNDPEAAPQDEEDDPESGSMDNNASVDEDEGVEAVEGIEELDEESAAAIAEVVKSRNRRRSSAKLEEKTKVAECDMDEGKLKPDPAVEEEEAAKKEEDEEENLEEEEEATPKAETGNSDDVLAKISAELLKIGEKLKEKPVKVELAEEVKESEKEPQLATEEDEKKPVKDEEESKNEEESKEDARKDKEEDPSKPPLDPKEDAEADGDNKLSGDEEKVEETSKLSTSSVHSSNSNLNLSGYKPAGDDDVASVKSNQSNASWVTLDLEHDEEVLRQKEQHLQNLGLLTHKAAEMRRQEFIQIAATTQQQQLQQPAHQPSAKRAKVGNASASAQEYTGTLKTVIKLNRNANGSASAAAATTSSAGHTRQKSQLQRDSGANRRQSLKMTFQKGRARGQGNGHDRHAGGDHNAPAEDSYYTIQNENEDSSHSDLPEAVSVLPASKKDEKEEILIPEKASSFKFHPGRLCEDQCFYCSGKFGLYDTPCHVGQIKSVERQQKILANEEKLTVDNCLCDACFRHVDRRANAPSYKKRLSAPGSLENASGGFGSDPAAAKEDGSGAGGDSEDVQSRRCVVPECPDPAAHSLRRKCIRKSVKKFFLNLDIPTLAPSVWLCKSHYDAVMQCSGCVLCKRRLGKNHMYHITSDTGGLEKALNDMGIPVHLGIGTAVCKLCRYFANLLMKPSESARNQKAEFVKNYRKKLLQFHNIHDVSNEASEGEPEEAGDASSGKAKGGKKANPSASPAGKQDSSSPLRSAKEMPSPAGSSGSSVECLGLSGSHAGASQRAPEHDTDFEGPLMSSDSNSSSPPLAAAAAAAASSDVPMSKLKAILQSSGSGKAAAAGGESSSADISTVLRANPNISMRELFPGEEDLGMNFYAPFGSNTSQRTPEGWTRVKTFLQYDEPTRRLWEELQKPYGNQSSFLRHLILLEKYYRNGDLILSPHASSNASVYTQTVRQRLVSFDQGHCGGLLPPTATPKKSSKEEGVAAVTPAKETRPPTIEIHEDDDEEMATRPVEGEASGSSEASRSESRPRSSSVDKLAKQLNTSAVTITARPKEPAKAAAKEPPQQQPAGDKDAGLNGGSLGGSNNSRSILKANLLGMNKSVEILPVSASSASSSPSSGVGKSVPGSIASSGAESKQQKILEVANKLLGFQMETAKFPSAGLLTSPPELVSFQRRSTGNMPPSSPSSAASTSSAAAASALQNNNNKRPAPAAAPSKPAPGARPAGPASSSSAGGSRAPPNVVILPDTLTAQERQQSKSWRPTLMPVAENQHLLAKGGPLYQTVDKRRLPAVVQVQSGGKPFLISIFDYNRMCILRREKILRDQMLKASKSKQGGEAGGKQSQGGQPSGQQKHHDHQQQQHQPPQPKGSSMPMGMAGGGPGYQKSMLTAKQQQQQVAQRQHFQLQMMQLQKQQMQQHAAMKAGGGGPQAGGPHSSGGSGPLRYQPIAPKGSQQPQQGNAGPPVSAASSFGTPPMIPMLANAINNSSWMWNNFPDANQMMLNGVAAAAAAAAQSQAPKMPQLLHKSGGGGGGGAGGSSSAAAKQLQHQQQQQQQQLMLDNNLMSKIPKSLTVIPQHKLMGKQANGQGQQSGGGSGGGGHKE